VHRPRRTVPTSMVSGSRDRARPGEDAPHDGERQAVRPPNLAHMRPPSNPQQATARHIAFQPAANYEQQELACREGHESDLSR